MAAYIEKVRRVEPHGTFMLSVVVDGYRATATVSLRYPDSIIVSGPGSPARAEQVRRVVRHALGR